jgi:hypothetical protein
VTRKRLIVVSMVLVVVLSGWRLVNALLIAGAVSPPRATVTEKLRLAFVNRPYQIAVPHRTVFERIHFSIVPEVHACGGGDPQCDSTTLHTACNPACPVTCGNCPNCANGPCTIYTCAPSTRLNRLCQVAYNQAPQCPTCEYDKLLGKCNPCTPPACY